MTNHTAAHSQLTLVPPSQHYPERRRASDRREAHYHTLVDSINDILFTLTPTGTFSYISPQWHETFGYELSETIGQSFRQFVHPDDNAHCLAALQKCIATGENLSRIEYRIRRKDGAYLWYSSSGSVIKDPADGAPMFIGLGRNITVRKHLEDELHAHQAEIRLFESRQRAHDLAVQIQAVREQERSHIGREVHDELGQVLTALRMDISLLSLRFGALDPALIENVQGMKALVDRAIKEVRNVALNLHPAGLDLGKGLRPALEWLCREFTQHSGVACELQAPPDPVQLDEAQATALFRIAQESLTNVVRYAQASQVSIVLERRSNALWLEVCDNGRGFDPAAATQSFGLSGMQERAQALGGAVTITSATRQGTLVSAQIPLHLGTVKQCP